MKLVVPKKLNMKWISVKDELPKIPKGRYAVAVIVAEFDPGYESLCIGRGFDVIHAMYGKVDNYRKKRMGLFKHWKKKEDFMQLYLGGRDSEWGPFCDEVTHWMYMPKPPKYKYTKQELKKIKEKKK